MKETNFEENNGNILLGITGSIGCGKTYTCNLLKEIAENNEMENSYLSIDTIRRNILGTNPKYEEVRLDLIDFFGNKIQKQDGSICGKELGEYIFNDSLLMQVFKAYTHKAIKDNFEDELKENKGITFVEWALLVEDNYLQFVNGNVLVVTCDYDIQIKRLSSGDLPLDQIKKRIENHYSNEKKISHIKQFQKAIGKGQLYVFDTTKNPKKKQYEELFENIIKND
ncbi:dephospho-CoA kinase [Nanoarchaeota archaeon]